MIRIGEAGRLMRPRPDLEPYQGSFRARVMDLVAWRRR